MNFIKDLAYNSSILFVWHTGTSQRASLTFYHFVRVNPPFIPTIKFINPKVFHPHFLPKLSLYSKKQSIKNKTAFSSPKPLSLSLSHTHTHTHTHIHNHGTCEGDHHYSHNHGFIHHSDYEEHW